MDADYLTAFGTWAYALSTAALAVASFCALSSWKSKLKGQTSFEFARELRAATLHLNRVVTDMLNLDLPVICHPDCKVPSKQRSSTYFWSFVSGPSQKIEVALDRLESILASGLVTTEKWQDLQAKINEMASCVREVRNAIHASGIMLDYRQSTLIEMFGNDFAKSTRLLFVAKDDALKVDFFKQLNKATTGLIGFADDHSGV